MKEENKVYDVNFVPEEVGVYALYIFLGDNLVNDMPSLLTVSDPDQVKVTGPGLGDTEGNTYPVKSPLVWEADCTTAGPGKLTAFCAGPDDCSKKFKIAPVPGKPDCYTVTYKPKKAGPYQVLLAYGGYETPQKPNFSISKPSFLALLFGKLKGEETPEESSVEPVEGNIHQTKNDDGTYTFGFVPEKPGLYEIAPSISDNPVFEEPLTVLVTDPEKVKVSGPGATGKGANVGKPTEVIVDRTEAGPAPVEGVLSTPSGEKQPLDFKPKDESNPDVLAASYTPEEPGNYQLDLTFDDEPIKKSPFTAKILEDGAPRIEGPGTESAAIGEENIIDLFMPAIVPEEVTMELMAPDHQEIPLDFFVDKVDDDHCQVKFTPEVECECDGQLLYAGAPVGEPFKIPIGDASKCKASGPGIEEGKLPVGKETYVLVDSTEAGPGAPKVVVTGPEDSEIEPVCTEEKPGVNKFTFTPKKGGPHEVAVLFGGHDIPGSPYTVPVCNPEGVKCAPVNPDNKKFHPGDEIEFGVDLKNAGEGEFNLGLVGPDNKPIVSEEAFIALVPVEETIDGNTEVVQLKPEGPKVGSTIPYSIDTSGVQTGDVISGKVIGPFKNKKKVPKELLSDKITLTSLPEVAKDRKILEPDVKEENKVFDVNFTPDEVGVYVLFIFLGDKLVDDMPCLLSVCDADEVKLIGPGIGDTEGESYQLRKPLIWQAYCANAGPGKLTAHCAGPDDCSKKFKISPIPGKENSFYIEYIPKKVGPYQLLFAYGDYEVSSKPTFTVTKPSYVALLAAHSAGLPEGRKSPEEKPEEGKIESAFNDDGTCTFKFTPEKPGLYEVMPTLQDEPVFEEPLSILVTDPDKVKVFGPGVTGKGLCIGKPTEIFLDRTNSGPGPVEAVLSTPTGERETIKFEPKEEDGVPNILVGRYTPQIAGYHSLSITFDDQQLPMSPLRVYVVKPDDFKLEGGGLKEAKIGEVNIIDCLLENMPEEGVFSMVTEDKNGDVEPLDCEIIKVDEDKCCIEFIPDTEDACFAILQFNEVPISDKIALAPNNIGDAEIRGLKRCQGVIINKERPFTADFSSCSPKEAAILSISMVQSDGSELKPTLIELEPGLYKVFFLPTVLGPLKITFKYGDEEMIYTVFVIDPSAVICTGLGGESTLVTEKQVFAIDTSAAGIGARLKLELDGEDQANLSCKHMIDDHYSGVLAVVLAGTYYVRIFYGGYEIKGSPFECTFHRPEPDASLVTLSDVAATPGKFMVDCRSAGGCGVLEVAAYGAYVPARYIAVEHNGDYTFNVQYDIPDPVETVISVKWHGEHLAGSPFKVVFKK